MIYCITVKKPTDTSEVLPSYTVAINDENYPLDTPFVIHK